MDYAELQVTTNYSFLRSGSHPKELVEQAIALGHTAIGITDRNTLAGVVRAFAASRGETKTDPDKIKLLVGSRIETRDGYSLLVYPTDLDAYKRLSRLLSQGNHRAAKGECDLTFADLADHAEGILAIVLPPRHLDDPAFHQRLRALALLFGDRCYLAGSMLFRGDDARRLARLDNLAAEFGVRFVATNDVHYHVPERRALQDVVTAIRLGCTVDELGFRRFASAERHLKDGREMARLFHRHPHAVENTQEIVRRCGFSLRQLTYQYPVLYEGGETPMDKLIRLTWEGARKRYRDGIPSDVATTIRHEFALIEHKKIAPYFLTVHEIVEYARSKEILCQGRGSAANSAVCYCLGITSVDPSKTTVLFERFLSNARDEPPDIDVDFEHERREEVIQWIYEEKGRTRAALAATVIAYRSRSAIREVGKVLGLSPDTVGVMADTVWGMGSSGVKVDHVRDAGLDPTDPRLMLALELSSALCGFPRHLSQHVGGFVLTEDRLDELVPIQNAAMDDRTVVEWDKDDLDVLGIYKVDVLALGMLTALRKGFALIEKHYGEKLTIGMDAKDKAVYDMLCRGESLGVFQVESRAQMSMLPRLKPQTYYDLVIEVAIVRPGPIQGGMVHPYLRRRMGLEPVHYPRDEIRPALERTLGVPIFQEQVMQIAMIAADFTGGEADALRRAMAAWRRKGGLEPFERRLVDGMLANGYQREFAEAIFRQIQGFGEYGFPESHAASFALLVYVSAWIKRHEPATFLAALLNSQPMGFYAPAQLVRDAREHGVEVRGVDALTSEWDCTLEETGVLPPWVAPADGSAIDRRAQPAVRLGLNRVRGFSEAGALRLLEARAARRRERGEAPAFDGVEDLARQARIDARELRALAQAGALRRLAGHRAQAHWEVAAIQPLPPLLHEARFDEPPTPIPAPPEGREIIADYRSLGIPMGRHPLALLRARLARLRVSTAAALAALPDGRPARASGLVTHRQRPGTAKGTIFVTLEDETGAVNVIVWPGVFERHRREVIGSQLMTVCGTWQRDTDTGGQVRHLVARRILDHSALLGELAVKSRDFR